MTSSEFHDLGDHDIKRGSNILREFDALLEAMKPKQPSTLWVYVNQIFTLESGLRGALRREGKPAGMDHKEFRKWLDKQPSSKGWVYKGVRIMAQRGRMAPDYQGDESEHFIGDHFVA